MDVRTARRMLRGNIRYVTTKALCPAQDNMATRNLENQTAAITEISPRQAHNIKNINIMLTNSVVNETPVRPLAVSPMSTHAHSIINTSVRQGQHPSSTDGEATSTK